MTEVNPFTNGNMQSMPMPQMPTPDPMPAPTVPAPDTKTNPELEALKEKARQAEMDSIEADLAAAVDQMHAEAVLEKAKKDKAASAEQQAAKMKATANELAKKARSKDSGMKSLERIGIMATIAGVACIAIYMVPTIQWLLSVVGTVLLIGGLGVLGYLLLKDKTRQDKIMKALTKSYEEATAAINEVRTETTDTNDKEDATKLND